MGRQQFRLLLFYLLCIHLKNVLGVLTSSSSSSASDTVSWNWVTISQVLSRFSQEFEDYVGAIASNKEPDSDETDAKLEKFMEIKLEVSGDKDEAFVNMKNYIVATYVAFYAVEYQLSFTLCHAQVLIGSSKTQQLLFVPPVDEETMSRCEKIAMSLHKLSHSYKEVLEKVFEMNPTIDSTESSEKQKSEEKPDLPSSSIFAKRSTSEIDEMKLIENLNLESCTKTVRKTCPSNSWKIAEVVYRELPFFKSANSKENLNFNKTLNFLLNYISRMSKIHQQLWQSIAQIKEDMKNERQASSSEEIAVAEISNADLYSKISEHIYKSVNPYRIYLRKYFSSLNVDEGFISIHGNSCRDERQLVTMQHFTWITASKILDRSFSEPLKKSSSSPKFGLGKLKKTRSLLPEESSLKLLSLCEELRSIGFAYFLHPGYFPVNINSLQVTSYPDFLVKWNENEKGKPDFEFTLSQ